MGCVSCMSCFEVPGLYSMSCMSCVRVVCVYDLEGVAPGEFVICMSCMNV